MSDITMTKTALWEDEHLEYPIKTRWFSEIIQIKGAGIANTARNTTERKNGLESIHSLGSRTQSGLNPVAAEQISSRKPSYMRYV